MRSGICHDIKDLIIATSKVLSMSGSTGTKRISISSSPVIREGKESGNPIVSSPC